VSEAVRQALMIAQDLCEQCHALIPRILRARLGDNAQQDEGAMRAEIERCYGGIWEQLDVAARHTRAAGRDTARFDTIRKVPGIDHQQFLRGIGERVVDEDAKTYTVEARGDVNRDGLALGLQATALLRAAWPELDFTPAPAPDVDLRPRGFGLFARLFGKR
jgi:hypothetical protein